MTVPLLAVDCISWSAGTTRVLHDVSFSIGSGELVAVLGRNGAGKSTLLDIIAGLRQQVTGTVRFDGIEAASKSAAARARVLSHLPQMIRPDLPFEAQELVLMGRYPHTSTWFASDADRRCVEDAMRRTNCWQFRHRTMQTLSGGERQRVLLAACLAQAARLLLLDEPSNHLDIDQQLHCFELLRDESRRGRACIAVMHDLNLALAFATRLVVLAEGRMVADLSVTEAAASTEWLSLFSPRLTLSTAGGRSWVSYS